MVPVDTLAFTRLKNKWELRGRTWIPMHIDSDEGDKGSLRNFDLKLFQDTANIPKH